MSYVGSGAVASTPEGDEPAWTKGGESAPYMPFTEDGSSGSSRETPYALGLFGSLFFGTYAFFGWYYSP